MEERIVTISFKKLLNCPRTKLIKRKVKFVKEFLSKKFKAEPKLSNRANRAIMLSKRKKVRLRVVKEKDVVRAFAIDEKIEEAKESKKEEKKDEKEKKIEKEKKEETKKENKKKEELKEEKKENK
jgi:ribosomal protein L31E